MTSITTCGVRRGARTSATRALLASACAAAVATAFGLSAAADEPVRFDVPAQDLGDALEQFSAQAGYQLIAQEAVIDGLSSQAVSGDMDADAALERLLGETRLNYTITEAGALIIKASAQAQAQEPVETTTAPVPEPVADELDDEAPQEADVVVVRGFRSSLARSLQDKRDANQVTDSISAEEIGQFPDQNVTDALSRIPGVQISRQSGEGESVNLRGLSGAFARVELDGRTVSATRDNNQPERFTALAAFSTELFDSVEVVKSPTAADVEGGIGGIVRLNTPDPLDIGERAFGGEFSVGVSEGYDFLPTNINGFWNEVFLDGRVGILSSLVLRHDDTRFDRFTGRRSPRTVEQLVDDDSFGEFPELEPFKDVWVNRRISYQQQKGDEEVVNFNTKLQFQVTEDFLLYGGGSYSFEDRQFHDSNIGVNPENGDVIPLTLVDPSATAPIIVNDEGAGIEVAYTNGRIDLNNDYNQLDNTIFGYNLGFEHQATDRLFLSGEFAVSESEEIRKRYQANVDVTEIELADGSIVPVTAIYSYVDNPEVPSLTLFNADEAFASALNQRFDRLRVSDREIREDDTSLQFDAEYERALGPITSFEAGVRYSILETERLRVRPRSEARRNADLLVLGDVIDAFATNVPDNLFEGGLPSPTPTSWPSVAANDVYNLFPSEDEGQFFDLDASGNQPPQNIEESDWAVYALANYDWTTGNGLNARGNVGVRVVTTQTKGNGAVEINQDFFESDPITGLPVANEDLERSEIFVAPTDLDAESTSVLPSLNVAASHEAYPSWIVRGAITRAETRPNFGAITPDVTLNQIFLDGELVLDQSSISAGNPELEPFLAWQYDLGVEYYFGETQEGLLSVGWFYKDLESVIDDGVREGPFTVTYNGEEFTVGELNTAVNAGDAVVNGVEINLQTPFTFLPGFWSDFGFVGNYTHIFEGEFTTADGFTQPFFDTSEDTYNITGYYERGGLSTRLAYNFRGEHRRGGDEFVDDFGRLDFAARYRFENGVRVSFDALNILEDERVTFDSPTDETDAVPIRSLTTLVDFEPVIYQFGVAYTF